MKASPLIALAGLIVGVTLVDRLQEVMAAMRWTHADLVRVSGESSSVVSQWLGNGSKTIKSIGSLRAAMNIERASGFSALWVAKGDGPKRLSRPPVTNVEAGPDLRPKVPLISWVQAGSWNGANDPLQPGEAERWIECPSSHSERTYALRVRGDSMTAVHGNSRTYPQGCIIFVDPLRKSPVNGERIIAKLEGSDEVTFKVFKQEDGRTWLQPINPTHDKLTEPFKVLGTVIGKWEDE